MNDQLKALLEAACARGPMTAAEIREQKISFVYGQMMDCAPDVTKDQIAKVLDEMEGRIPPSAVTRAQKEKPNG